MENEVSEIQEEPDEDFEDGANGFSSIIEKSAYDYGKIVESEGIELE